jgi:hypothetical protein
MYNHKRDRHSRAITLFCLIGIIGLGCLCLPTNIGLTSTITPVAPMPVIPTPPPTPAPTEEAAPVSRLDAAGPWLLIETEQGLWATNSDGTGLTLLITGNSWQWGAVQPDGNTVAFINPGMFDFHHMALNLVSLPDGKVTKVTDLTSAQTEAYADSGPGDPGFEALRAIGEQRSLAWSPDGTRLAFIGAMDGPSADVYIWNSTTNEITRVSQDEAQDFWPSWSPEGEHLLYFEAKGFGTGAGMVMTGAWVAAGDGSETRLLYNTDSSGEVNAGWLDSSTSVLASWNVVCGFARLRLYNVETDQVQMLNEGCFTSAVASGWKGAALYSTDSGLYILTADDHNSVQVSQEANARIDQWGPDDYVFTARFDSGGMGTFGPGDFDTQVSPFIIPPGSSQTPYDDLDVAMYGAIWGWTSMADSDPGVWISGPGIDIGLIYPGKARFPAWSPDNNLLFFALTEGGGYDLYRTTFDAHYTDLSQLEHLDGKIVGVMWMGSR